MARQGLLMLVLGCTALLGTSPAAPAAGRGKPKFVVARFVDRPVVGQPATLVVRLRDPIAAVNGFQVDFGDGSMIKESACRPLVDQKPFTESPFGPNTAQTFTASHIYLLPGRLTVRVTGMSGDCVNGLAAFVVEEEVRVALARGPTEEPVEIFHPKPKKAAAMDEVAARPSPRAALAAAPCTDTALLPVPGNELALRAAELCLVNAVREGQGLARVSLTKKLNRAARRHSLDMVARDFFAHETPDGLGLRSRLKRAKVSTSIPAAENLAAGTMEYATPLGVVLAWLESPPHRANLLDRDYRRAGLGVANGMPGIDETTAATYTLILSERR